MHFVMLETGFWFMNLTKNNLEGEICFELDIYIALYLVVFKN